MCGHVVRPFGRMAIGAILRCDAAEKILQIILDVRIGIFLNGQGGRRVLDEQGEQAILHGLLIAPGNNRSGDLIQPWAACFGAQCLSYLNHPASVRDNRRLAYENRC